MIGGAKLKELSRHVIRGLDYDLIGNSSVDVRLGDNFQGFESDSQEPMDLFGPSDQKLARLYRILPEEDDTITLRPGQFILAETQEFFTLPKNVSAMFSLRSRLARAGLQQAVSVWARPEWSGHLVLELSNDAPYPLRLKVGMPIGQMHFFNVNG